MKKHIWKIISLVFLLVSCTLAYLLWQKTAKSRAQNTLSLSEIDPSDYEYKKKQNPNFAADNNDYFFQNPTTIQFLNDEYNFDTIAVNKIISQEIKYINTGGNPYFITDIKVSCGCTVPSYDNRPIAAGDTGIVKIEYNSAKKSGFNMNKLSLFGNTEPKERSVYFKIFVKSNLH